MSLSADIKSKAVDLGFDVVGLAPAQAARREPAFHRWLELGYHGEMEWMARDPGRRADPRRVLPGARSVVVAGVSYFVENPPPDVWNDPARGRIARYAWGPDYHDVLLPRLQALARFIEQQASHPVQHRAYVDTGPILERGVAAEAGLGFIGRNSLLIHPSYGSYLLLGEILLDIELEYDPPAGDEGAARHFFGPTGAPRKGSCGSCRRCLDVCPTHAFPAAYILDSRRCISYLTIELKGSIPDPLRPLMGNWIFGCDECQSVCPWVRRYARPGRTHVERYNIDRMAPPLLDLMPMDEVAFRARFRGTPILRARRRGLLRNVAVALGNWGSRQAVPVLERAGADPDPIIREHAAWALHRIRHSGPACSPPG
jgi:epoxyqueuosine reductase